MLWHKVQGAGGVGEPFVVASSSTREAINTTIVINKPTGTLDDDYIIAFVRSADNGAIISANDAGWALLEAETLSKPETKIFGRVASGEPSTYSFSETGVTGGSMSGVIVAVRNGAFDSVGATNSSTGTVVTANSVTMSQKGLILGAFFWNTAPTISSLPSGMTVVNDDQEGLGGCAVVYREKVASGSTGSRSLSLSSSVDNKGNLVGFV